MTDQQAQVWTEDRFIAALSEHSEAHKNDWNAALELGWKIICEYEAALAKANQQRDEALAQVTELQRQMESFDKAASIYMKNAMHITADLCVASKRAINILRGLMNSENQHAVLPVIRALQDALGVNDGSENDDD